MKKQILLLLFILVIISACTPKQEEEVRGIIEEHKGEIETGIKETVQKQNCQSYNGYICSAPDDCGLPYLNTTESYCCPIKCQTCNQSCDDGNECTTDSCLKQTNYSCMFTKIKGSCQNDGFCDGNEANCAGLNTGTPTEYGITEIPSTGESICSGASASSAGVGIGCNFKNAKPNKPNADCPTTCNDDDASTFDRYDTEKQECQHIPNCDDGDSSTNDWFNLRVNSCAHCKICTGPICPA